MSARPFGGSTSRGRTMSTETEADLERIERLRDHVDSELVTIEVLSVSYPIEAVKAARYLMEDKVTADEYREAVCFLLQSAEAALQKHAERRESAWCDLSEIEDAIKGVSADDRQARRFQRGG